MKNQSRFVLACALLATAAGIVGARRAHADPHGLLAANSSAQNSGDENNAPLLYRVQANSDETVQPKTAVALRFAVESQLVTDASDLSAKACPQTSATAASPTTVAPTKTVTVDPKILDAISGEMQKRLSKKNFVMVDPNPAAIPVGATVISGCITGAKNGNAGARLIGMNVGASRLSVHVVALSKTKDGWSPVDNFDIKVKGGDLLPPLGPVGLAVHAARDTRQSLSADAPKLADHILKKLSKDMKAREQIAKA